MKGDKAAVDSPAQATATAAAPVAEAEVLKPRSRGTCIIPMSSTGIVSKRFSKAKMKILPRWRICTIGKRPSSSDREQTSARFKDQLITSVTKEYGGVDETEKKESKTTAAVGLQEFGGDTDDVFR